MKAVEERRYLPLENSPCEWISTPEQLEALAQLLDQQTEIAIDLEQHGYRSFQVCQCLQVCVYVCALCTI